MASPSATKRNKRRRQRRDEVMAKRGFMTVAEAATKAYVSVATIYRMVASETITGLKAGKKLFIASDKKWTEYLGALPRNTTKKDR